MDNGKIIAAPGHLIGGKAEANVWQYVVLTANENQVCLYLNGEKIASGPGTKDITTDALDFFTGHNVVLNSLQLFDRFIQPIEVKRLYDVEKK